MRNKLVSLGLALLLCAGVLVGCSSQTPAAPEATETPQAQVTLTVAGSWPQCRALDEIAKAFMAENPSCTIVYEYLQDYYPSLERRMTGEAPVDLFFTNNIQSDSALLPYALDLRSRSDIDLSHTFDGLIENFVFMEPTGETNTKLYAAPIGAEMRGMYVNKTLLASVGLEVPTDQASLLAACETLKRNGYIPFHGNPGNFGQLLVYPWIANLIVNADDPKAAYDFVNTRQPGISDMLRAPYAFIYTLVENDYYDYKRAQTESDLFNTTSDEAYARDFLNIRTVGEDAYEKADDLGQVAFMPVAMSAGTTIDKTKEDYHSEIEYEFIPSPVGPEGGFAYLSPAHGIAVNKASAHVDWCAKFIDFFFRPENNETFAKVFNVIPNTKDAFAYIKTLYNIPDDRVSHLGEVTFSYGFYTLLTPSLVEVSKANNPKYMHDDGAGNLTLYPLEHYLQELEASIVEP